MITGFTLIELLVVIAIIGTLASVVLASLNSARERARDSTRVTTLRSLEHALQLYWVDNGGQYPSTGGSWYGDSSCTAGWFTDRDANDWIPGLVVQGYMSELPQDPSENGCNTYLYRSNGDDFKLLAHGTMESCNPGSCQLQDPLRTSQLTSSVYSENAVNW